MAPDQCQSLAQWLIPAAALPHLYNIVASVCRENCGPFSSFMWRVLGDIETAVFRAARAIILSRGCLPTLADLVGRENGARFSRPTYTCEPSLLEQKGDVPRSAPLRRPICETCAVLSARPEITTCLFVSSGHTQVGRRFFHVLRRHHRVRASNLAQQMAFAAGARISLLSDPYEGGEKGRI